MKIGPRVQQSIANEMNAAKRHFADLPENAWQLPVQEEGWRGVAEKVEAFAYENHRVYRFVNGLEEFAWRERDLPGADSRGRQPKRRRTG